MDYHMEIIVQTMAFGIRFTTIKYKLVLSNCYGIIDLQGILWFVKYSDTHTPLSIISFYTPLSINSFFLLYGLQMIKYAINWMNITKTSVFRSWATLGDLKLDSYHGNMNAIVSLSFVWLPGLSPAVSSSDFPFNANTQVFDDTSIWKLFKHCSFLINIKTVIDLWGLVLKERIGTSIEL